ncbi:MAG TPA: ABC transporter permease, partial [Ktedonobacteraceae bacterium]|nr:ABC transporter permease [Ktedonobacteraceae bacterium]
MKQSRRALVETVAPLIRPAFYWTLADAFVMAKRQIRQIPRIPDELVTSLVQPVITVLLFRYLFGGAITVPGTSYVNYLMAGVFVQSIVFGSASVGVGVANDLQRGLIDRFRSLPMARSAVLTGRIVADQIR